jgi:hypothetical protein
VAAHANQDALDFDESALRVCDRLGAPFRASAVVLALATATNLGDRSLVGMALGYRGFVEIWNRELERAEMTLRAAMVVGQEGHDEVRAQAGVA